MLYQTDKVCIYFCDLLQQGVYGIAHFGPYLIAGEDAGLTDGIVAENLDAEVVADNLDGGNEVETWGEGGDIVQLHIEERRFGLVAFGDEVVVCVAWIAIVADMQRVGMISKTIVAIDEAVRVAHCAYSADRQDVAACIADVDDTCSLLQLAAGLDYIACTYTHEDNLHLREHLLTLVVLSLLGCENDGFVL